MFSKFLMFSLTICSLLFFNSESFGFFRLRKNIVNVNVNNVAATNVQVKAVGGVFFHRRDVVNVNVAAVHSYVPVQTAAIVVNAVPIQTVATVVKAVPVQEEVNVVTVAQPVIVGVVAAQPVRTYGYSGYAGYAGGCGISQSFYGSTGYNQSVVTTQIIQRDKVIVAAPVVRVRVR